VQALYNHRGKNVKQVSFKPEPEDCSPLLGYRGMAIGNSY